MRARAMFRMAWLTLSRDRLGVALYAVVPIIFLSIFATVFEGFGRHGESRVRIAVLDLDDSAASRRLVAAAGDSGDRIELVPVSGNGPEAIDAGVASGGFPAGVVVPRGFGAALGDPSKPIPALEVRFDPANPIAPEFAEGVLSGAAWTGLAPELLGRQLKVLQVATGPLTDRQRRLLDGLAAASAAPASEASSESSSAATPTAADGPTANIADAARIPIDAAPVRLGHGTPSLVTYYTAAIGVMFLLFSALSTTGWLLEEQERGILDRLRASGLGPWSILLNRFVFSVVVGGLQLCVMLAWAAAVFDVRFFSMRQFVSLAILIPAIAGAAAALGLLITAAARTRRQQTTIGTIAVLVLSAVGGSMIPSFLMPDSLQEVGRWAFNARAISAMQQVLWYTSPGDSLSAMLARIAPSLLVILATAACCLVTARILVARWR